MKVVKIVLSSLLVLAGLSTQASAYVHGDVQKTEARYEGYGFYVDVEGQERKYGASLSVQLNEGGSMSFTETYRSQSQTKEYNYSIANKDDYKFVVYNDEGEIGKGYCFKAKWKNKKVCHMEVMMENATIEKTIAIDFTNGMIRRVGSKTVSGEEGGMYIFKDSLWLLK